MTRSLPDRFEEVLSKVTSPQFVSSEGIGNEIACYILDYDAEDELAVRDQVRLLRERLKSHHGTMKVLEINVFDGIAEYLESRGMLQKAIEMHATKGPGGVLRALRGPLATSKVRDFIAAKHSPSDYDLVLMTGIGSAWPMLRAHALLNSLHTIMATTPLVLFYPGTFDGISLRLFGQIASAAKTPNGKAYYRAFQLAPRT